MTARTAVEASLPADLTGELQALAGQFPDLEVYFSTWPAKRMVQLQTLKARKTAAPGTGTAFMQALVRWADRHGIILVLQTGLKDRADRQSQFKTTTSQGRLARFYKRFGFVSNYGRPYRPDLPGNMHREPRVIRP